MFTLRRSVHHSSFYPGDCHLQVAEFLKEYRPAPPGSPPLLAAVVPHAGWCFSGGVAARTLKTLSDRSRPASIVLFGAVHRAAIRRCAVYPTGEWMTPLGAVRIDEKLASDLLQELPDLLEENPAAHETEHSLEVQLPFIHEIFPNIPVLPIMVPPDAPSVELGSRVAAIVRDRSTVAVATTDLTHYGDVYGFCPAGVGDRAHRWMRENDSRIIDMAVRMEAEGITAEARKSWNACGPGALSAAVAFAKALGVRHGCLLERTDSHEVQERGESFRMAVGYAGLVF